MKIIADLHSHTIYSDGSLTPLELITRAKNLGIEYLGITDHDSIGAIKEAIEIGNDLGVKIIPGVEVSTEYYHKELHILGYYINIENEALLNYLTNFREERVKRAERMIVKLRQLGFNLTMDDVMEISNGSSIARTHIAEAMVNKNIVSNYFEAFGKFIGNSGPAFEKKIHLSPKDVIELINKASGLSFLAHPNYIPDKYIQALIKSGLDGIETVHPSHDSAKTDYFRKIASIHYLLESGGSDFHGGLRNDFKNFGKFGTSVENIHSMKKRLNIA
ncbi:MAG: PHP domain-containing protein [Ignavibacteria bacterium]|nr:PHP domain-containing protein [Ignavibacteria bacterium]